MSEELKMIDCFGDICPIPILKIEKELESTPKGGEFMLVTDHSCVLESIKDVYLKKDIIMEIDEVMNGVWEIYFKVK